MPVVIPLPPNRATPILVPVRPVNPRDISSATEALPNHQMSHQWSGFFSKLAATLNQTFAQAFTGTIATAKLTPGGTNGSMTFVNGVITIVVPPT